MIGGGGMEMGSRSSRKWCYRMRERLVIEHNGLCRGGGMHLLIELRWNVRVVPLKRGVLGWDR